MNDFSITPFHGLHLILLLLTAAAALLIFLLLRKKPEARCSQFLIGACLFNLALFAGYKLSLSMDAVYVRAYYPNGFNNFNELPLALTVLEAGQVLRVGRNVAYELVRSGQLRSVRVGKNIRIPRDALAEYLNLAS